MIPTAKEAKTISTNNLIQQYIDSLSPNDLHLLENVEVKINEAIDEAKTYTSVSLIDIPYSTRNILAAILHLLNYQTSFYNDDSLLIAWD